MKILFVVCLLGMLNHFEVIHVGLGKEASSLIPAELKEARSIMANAGVLSMMTETELKTAISARNEFLASLN